MNKTEKTDAEMRKNFSHLISKHTAKKMIGNSKKYNVATAQQVAEKTRF